MEQGAAASFDQREQLVKLPQNPFPIDDGAIRKELFVGREEILEAFDEFLKTDVGKGKNAFWMVTGSRGQGKSSLWNALRLRALSKTGVALGAWKWPSEGLPSSTISAELYSSILAQDMASSPVTSRGIFLFKTNAWFNELSINLYLIKLSLKRYRERFSTPRGLIERLSSTLKKEIEVVPFLVDEVSINPDVSVVQTAQFAQAVADTKLEVGQRPLNLITIAFVQPQHAELLSARKGGPRSRIDFHLQDFTEAEIAEVVQKGLKLTETANSGRALSVTGDIAAVAEVVKNLTGGVPTLSLGLLYDGYEQMVTRVANSNGEAPPIMQAVDVYKSRELKISQVNSRLAQFQFDLRLPDANPMNQQHARALLESLALGFYGDGPWQIDELKHSMQSKIGKAVQRSKVIDPLISALESAALIVIDDKEVRFRGTILRQSLMSSKVS